MNPKTYNINLFYQKFLTNPDQCRIHLLSLGSINVNVLDKVQSDHSYMVLITCKKCGELDYLTSKAFWNITDFGAKCEKCETINTITLEKGELKKQEKFAFLGKFYKHRAERKLLILYLVIYDQYQL